MRKKSNKKCQFSDLNTDIKINERNDDDFNKVKLKHVTPSQRISNLKVAFPKMHERFYSGEISKEHINSSKSRASKNHNFECNKSSFKIPKYNIATSSVDSGSP